MTIDDPRLPVHLARLVAAWLGYFVLHSLILGLQLRGMEPRRRRASRRSR